MTTINSKEFLDSYHRGQLPFSFGGKHHVKDYVDISNADLDKNLSKSDVYTEFREFRKPKFTPPIRTYGKNYLWEADLMFFTHPDFAKVNDGKLYVLAVIDTFTKLVCLKTLKTKTGVDVTKAMARLFELLDTPKYLRIDAGGEFLNQQFINMCKSYKVIMYIAMGQYFLFTHQM